ncbi:PEP-CTERM sorting domain-containing protein [Pseudanabaenaceae cyanobacterium LEGE 13415]|nr:PEP-CTERM sorting domain-containing protein [Pseudanabaenaceae cyanobacterium LEGE 13415]
MATGTIAAFESSAHAASFTAQDAVNAGCVGATTCTVNGFTLSATDNSNPANPRNITQKNVNGFLGLGVRNGENPDPSGGEIDFNEILNVGFGRALTLKSLDLSFLYQPGVFADKVFEVALVKATGGIQTGKLRVTGNTTAVWESPTGFGSVLNLSPSTKRGGGSYRITNPFGDDKITGFSLTALKVRSDDPTQACSSGRKCPSGSDNSDFALTAVQVPEPTTVAGLGLVGLLAFARRRTAVKAD